MNPQYKEISYHQLMKKIEVLNELNTDQKWFYNKLSEAGGAFGSPEKDKKMMDARKKYQLVKDNKLSTEEQIQKAQDILHDEVNAINSAPDEEDATPDGEKTGDSEDSKKDGKSGILGSLASILGPKNLWGAYKSAVKNKMSRSEGIGSYLLPNSQKDTSGSRKMTQNDCAQLKLDTIPGKWPSVKVRYGCKN